MRRLGEEKKAEISLSITAALSYPTHTTDVHGTGTIMTRDFTIN